MSRSPSRSISPAAGVTDHGALTGLGDDDHPQYTTTAEAQALVDTEATARATADGLLVGKSLYDANSILAATTDDTPAALTVGASTIVGRKASGGIVALTGAEALAITGAIAASTLDANTVLAAVTDDTPVALSVPASTFVGRKASGNVTAMSVAEATTLLGITAGGITDLPDLGYVTGRYYGWQFIPGSQGTRATAANQIYFVPFVCRRTATFDRIGIRISTGVSGTVRLGIYAADATNGLPGTLVVEAGTPPSTTSSSSDALATINQQLTGGVTYWLAALFSANPTVGAVTATAGLTTLGGSTLSASPDASVVRGSFAYAALPTPGGAVTYDGGSPLDIRLRAA